MKTVAQADLATWHVPQCPFVIEYSRALLAEIERAVCEAFYSAPHGGVETAGVLFGIHLEGVLRIAAFRPMECEHLHGPGFLVSDKDRANLDALLERSSRDPTLHGLAPAGWYHSHTRGGIFLSDADLELHRRVFPKSWQVALVLRPSLNAATRAGFFFQEGDGTILSQDCYREFELAGAEAAVPGNRVAVSPGRETYRREPGPAASPKPGGLPLARPAANAPAARSVPAPPSMPAMAPRARPADAPAGKSKGRYWPWVAAGLVLGIAGASWYESETPSPPPPAKVAPLHLRAADQSGLLRIEWDKNTVASTELLGGSLEIRDGETTTNLPLDPAAIRVGSFEVVRHSPKARVTLAIRVLGAGPIEEVTEFSGPMPPADGAEATARAPDANTAPAASAKAAAETAAVRPAADRPAERPSDKKDQRNKEERASDSARRQTTQAPAPPPQRETPSTPVSTVAAAGSGLNTAPPRQQTAEATRPPAPAASSAGRPPSDTPVTPAASRAAENAPSVPRPGPAASQPPGSGTAVSPAPASSPAPKAAPAEAPPPRPIVAPLSGLWVHGLDVPTGSPFPPESLRLTLNESAGRLTGSFSGSYKVPKNRKLNGKVDFMFAGPAGAGLARFPFTSADGSKGEVEIIRVAGHIDTIEVVWHSSRDQITFDDVFQRVP